MHFNFLYQAYLKWSNSRLSKIWVAMQLTGIIMLACCLQVSATAFGQKITIQKKDMTLREVFRDIRKQSGYNFLYSNKTIAGSGRVSLDVKNAGVPDILDQAFSGKPLIYTIENKVIIIKRKPVLPKLISEIPLQNEISGVVKDSATGEPLVGVTIKVKGTTTGTVTDAQGRFSLDVPDGAVLEVSYVGYGSKSIAVDGQSSLDISLASSATGLNQLVVVGYGTQKKADLTGAVASISGDDIVERKTTQLSQALQGSMPGVMVTRNNNRPGSSGTIRLRGITTIGDSDPLIIVDGVKVDNIDDINPNDVEDISVLKDAASASIYGSQAAAGVILITTKRAKTDEFDLEYSYEDGFETPTEVPKFVNVIRYMQMLNETRWNDAGNGSNEYPTYGKDIIDNYFQLNENNPDKYPNTNWSDLIFKKYAPRQSHFLRLSGGTEKLKSTVSFSYDEIGAFYEKYSYKRLTVRTNNDFTINNYLKAYIDGSFRRAITDQPYTNLNLMRIARFSPPVYAATWEDGRYAEGKTGDNIYAQIKEGGFKKDWNNHLGARAGIDFSPIKGLKIQAIFASRFNKIKQKNFRKKIPWYLSDDPSILGGYIQQPTTLWETRDDNYNITSQLLGHYNKNIGNHFINLLVGYEDYYSFHENLSASRDNFELTEYPYLDVGPLGLRDNSGAAYEYARRSFFGRVDYSFNGKYLLQANVRLDGSSRFARNRRWGTFPSASVGWVISKESFMQNLSFLPFLKLRFSYGLLGNERIGNYPYQATMTFNDALFLQDGNVVSKQSAAQTQYAINDITWEKTRSYNIGIDASFLNERLNFTGDIYKKKTKDMLLPIQIPTYMGYDNPEQNTGDMYTRGWEINLNYNDNIGQVKFNISFNVSNFISKMGDLGGTEFLGDQIKIEGSEFNEWYGYRTDGLFQNQSDLENSALISQNTQMGDIKYVDISGSTGKKDGRISPEYDRVLLGGSLPKYTYGGTIKLNYKEFDLGITIQGVGRQNVRVDPLWVEPLLQNWLNMTTLLDGNYYSHYNTPEQNMKAKYPRLTYSDPGSNYVMSDFWLFNGRYMRIKNIGIGYNIHSQFMDNIKVKKIRLYVNISDLFSFDKYPKGYDPEGNIEDYPITTNVVFGASIKF